MAIAWHGARLRFAASRANFFQATATEEVGAIIFLRLHPACESRQVRHVLLVSCLHCNRGCAAGLSDFLSLCHVKALDDWLSAPRIDDVPAFPAVTRHGRITVARFWDSFSSSIVILCVYRHATHSRHF